MNVMPVIPNVKTSTNYTPKFGNNHEGMVIRHENPCKNFWDGDCEQDDLIQRKAEIKGELRGLSEAISGLTRVCPSLNNDDCDCITVVSLIKEYTEDIKSLKEELKEINQKLK